MAGENNEFQIEGFEAALDQLEDIVKALEEGNISLDEALQRFEAGIRLARYCNSKLNQAEKRINLLMKEDGGNIIIKPADFSEEYND